MTENTDLYWELREAERRAGGPVIVRVQYRDELDVIASFVGASETYLLVLTMQDKEDHTETEVPLDEHTLIDGVPANDWKAP